MARPHSPDCLLWAKHMKDEQTKLKTRTSHLEKTTTEHDADFANIKAIVADLQEHAHGITTLTERVLNLERHNRELESPCESLANGLRDHVAQLDKRLETHVYKIASLERCNTELREDHENTDRVNEALLQRVESTEKAMGNLARVSPKLVRKNDPSSATALGQMIESMRVWQETDRQTIQRMQGQFQRLAGIVTASSHALGPSVSTETPLGPEESSPIVQVAGSPLVKKQARTAAKGPSMRDQTMDALTPSDYRGTASKAPIRAPTLKINLARAGTGRAPAPAPSTLKSKAKPPQVKKKVRAAKSNINRERSYSQSTRVTRSQTRMADLKTQPPLAADHQGIPTQLVHSTDSQPQATFAQQGLEKGTGVADLSKSTNTRIVIAHSKRRRRSVSTQPQLPAFEDMSD